MMKGRAICFACIFCLPLAAIAKPFPTANTFLACSAEYRARAEYSSALGYGNPAHLTFLKDRSDTFLSFAEEASPYAPVPCDDTQRLALGLVYCQGPPSLARNRENLVLDRLTEFAETYRGVDRPPVCMEDQACSDCLRLLDVLVQSKHRRLTGSRP